MPDGAAELKRMAVAPQARGRGIAATLLEHAEKPPRLSGVSGARCASLVISS
ncbi:GNAT family N-acetyltransferase [Arthrobacter bambusae]|uniref:GNAT family N-acetyltransferase n=1 Tax=Arthrobacter bambusae TaxID=1338426 RepID=UPI00352243FA